MKKESSINYTLILSFLILNVFMLLAGLWPCKFFPPNKVLQKSDATSSYLLFSPPSLAYLKPQVQFNLKDGFSVSLRLKSLETTPKYLYRILSVQDHTDDFFSISQWKKGVVIRIYSVDNIKKETGYNCAFKTDSIVSITVTAISNQLQLFYNDSLVSTLQLPPSFISKPVNGFIILGNTAAGDHPWSGEIHGLAITAGNKNQFVYDYSTNQKYTNVKQTTLIIPQRFAPLIKKILTPPWKEYRNDRGYFVDLFLNLTGFIPSGLILGVICIRSRKKMLKAFFFSLLASFSVSITIELLQTLLPSRTSQLSDLLLNISGGITGTLLSYKIIAQRFKSFLSI